MSRIGKKPVVIPEGVTVELLDGHKLQVKGPKGTLTEQFHSRIDINIDGGSIVVTRKSDDKEDRSLHGLTRSLIQNMVDGVTKGYVKELEINGVGYRAALQGKMLVLNLPQKSEARSLPSRIRAKALNMLMNLYAVKKVKQAAQARNKKGSDAIWQKN